MPKFRFYLERLHANWPAYPAAHGPELALETLCWFPAGTHFEVVDDIDQCLLMLAREYVDPRNEADRYSERHFHVAVWRKDLRLLRDRGWVSGVSFPARLTI